MCVFDLCFSKSPLGDSIDLVNLPLESHLKGLQWGVYQGRRSRPWRQLEKQNIHLWFFMRELCWLPAADADVIIMAGSFTSPNKTTQPNLLNLVLLVLVCRTCAQLLVIKQSISRTCKCNFLTLMSSINLLMVTQQSFCSLEMFLC